MVGCDVRAGAVTVDEIDLRRANRGRQPANDGGGPRRVPHPPEGADLQHLDACGAQLRGKVPFGACNGNRGHACAIEAADQLKRN